MKCRCASRKVVKVRREVGKRRDCCACDVMRERMHLVGLGD